MYIHRWAFLYSKYQWSLTQWPLQDKNSGAASIKYFKNPNLKHSTSAKWVQQTWTLGSFCFLTPEPFRHIFFLCTRVPMRAHPHVLVQPLQCHVENTSSAPAVRSATGPCPNLVNFMFCSLTPDGLPRPGKPGNNAWPSARNTCLNKCSLLRTSCARGTAETLLSEITSGSKAAWWLSTISPQKGAPNTGIVVPKFPPQPECGGSHSVIRSPLIFSRIKG